jgi:hypothetical protein
MTRLARLTLLRKNTDQIFHQWGALVQEKTLSDLARYLLHYY